MHKKEKYMKKKLLVMFEIMLFTGVIASGYFIRSENLKFGIRIFILAVMYGIYYRWFRISQRNDGGEEI